MSIEYEVKDVIFVVIKHWYIVLGCILICGLLSIPWSKKSYEESLNSYQELTKDPSDSTEQINSDIYIHISDIGNEQMNKAFAQDILTIAKSLNKEEYELLEFEMLYLESANTVILKGKNMKRNEYVSFLANLKDDIDGILMENVNSDIEIDIKDVINELSHEEAEMLMKEPDLRKTNIKIIGTASVFGFLLGLMVVMVWDYVRCCKRILATHQGEA